jgi:hypothetical protein
LMPVWDSSGESRFKRKNGSVVVSTTRIDHLDLLASAASGFVP